MDGSMLNKTFDRVSRIVTIEINTVGSSANILNKQFFRELNEILDRAENDKGIKGIVFTTGKDKIFLAGADLVTLQKNLDNEKALDALIQEGQDTFNRIQNLHVPTVAAIHGACLGGGLEFALACDVRVASNDPCTKIGLPEVMLGVLPAWGGCTRLTRLIGVIKSLKFILSGTPKPSKVCKKLGIVDKITYKEELLNTAIKHCKRIKRKSLFLRNPLNRFIFYKAKKATMNKTKGNYPAPISIINVIAKSTKMSLKRSLLLEKKTFIKLAQTNACKSLIRIFFLQEQAKKLRWKNMNCLSEKQSDINPVNKTVVVGAGIMGSGIAQWLSTRGRDVLLKDISTQQIGAGLKNIGSLFVSGVLKHKITRTKAKESMARISTSCDNTSLKDKDLVIEAIAENFNLKSKVLKDIESYINDDAVLATNTSALSITELATDLKHPERFIGIHFFNPVHKMKLVEVVVGEKTNDETIARAIKFVQSIGKFPVVVADKPGFLVNRILLPYLIKSIELITLGGDVRLIDKAMVKFGMPMGPFRLLDEIGLDVAVHVARDLAERLPHFTSPEGLDNILVQGDYGKKTGAGFYNYSNGKKGHVNESLVSLLQKNNSTSFNEQKITNLLVTVMVEESSKCLYENVVTDSDSLDFAMIMGTGWAPFRGGPIQHSNTKI